MWGQIFYDILWLRDAYRSMSSPKMANTLSPMLPEAVFGECYVDDEDDADVSFIFFSPSVKESISRRTWCLAGLQTLAMFWPWHADLATVSESFPAESASVTGTAVLLSWLSRRSFPSCSFSSHFDFFPLHCFRLVLCAAQVRLLPSKHFPIDCQQRVCPSPAKCQVATGRIPHQPPRIEKAGPISWQKNKTDFWNTLETKRNNLWKCK